MSPQPNPRGIAVFDVGSTNTKMFLFDSALNLLAEETTVSPKREGSPYRAIDADPIIAFAEDALPRFDAILPVDVIVPSAHGSGLALMDGNGELVLPIMDYEAEPPQDVIDGYAALEPPFNEVFAPTNPGALTLARQLYWQETHHAEAFARVKTILPWGQYLAYRLCGVTASEVTAFGAQTHLWDVKANRFSSLARARGWDTLFAPIRNAWDRVGSWKGAAGLAGRAEIAAGIHDSNANFLRYLADGRDGFTLLSTGTWIIGFDTESNIASLDPRFDVASNTNIFGKPVASCRFMGGREFGLLAGDAPADAACLEVAARLVERGTMALPSFTDSGGPKPGTGGNGRIEGEAPQSPEERASLAAIYCAQMTSASLDAVNASGDLIVDGPFSENAVYLDILAALRTESRVFASNVRNGTSSGAALLAFIGEDGQLPRHQVDLRPIKPEPLDSLAAYQTKWQDLSRI